MKKYRNFIIVVLIVLASSILGLFGCKKEYIQPQSVSITIDDAPRFDANTIGILDVLKKHKVQATFFCIGVDIEQHYDIMNRMHNEGHIIGNHTYSHIDLKSTSLEKVFINEIIKTQNLVDSLNHYQYDRFFRPPYGSLSSNQESYLEHMGYKVRYWDWDASDWDNNVTVEQIIQYHKNKINTNTLENPVMLFHLSNQSVIALDSVLTYLKQKHIKVKLLN